MMTETVKRQIKVVSEMQICDMTNIDKLPDKLFEAAYSCGFAELMDYLEQHRNDMTECMQYITVGE